MAHIVSATSPNVEGELLWCVHYMSSYYDDDPRMPGTVPIDSRLFVLAKNREEALKKVEAEINKARRKKDKNVEESIKVTVVTIEDLIPARNSRGDGRLGLISGNSLSEVRLCCPEDFRRYRLAVCLVPVE